MQSLTPQSNAGSPLDALCSPRRQIVLAMLASLLLALAWFVSPQPVQPLLAVSLLWTIVIILYRPFMICLVFVGFSYFRIHEAFPDLQSLKLPNSLGICAIAALVFHVVLARSIRPIWSQEMKLFVIFFGLVSIGAVLAVNPERATTYWTDIYVKIGLMTLAIAWLTRTRDDFAAAARVLVICGALIAIVAIYNKIHGIDLVGGTRVSIGREFDSILADPNDLALALLFPLAFAAAQLIHRSSALNTAMGALAAPLLTGAIVATQSRGGLLGVLFVAMAIGQRLVRRKWLLWGIGGALVLVLYVAMGISQRNDYGAQVDGVDESSLGRIYTWFAAAKMAIARPLTGVGLDNFVEAYDGYRADFDNKDHAVHSTWFQVLAETGFPGIIVFAAMVLVCFRSINRCLKALVEARADPILCASALSLSAGLAGFCAAGTFLTQAFTWPLYVMVALTTALVSFAEREIGLRASELRPANDPASKDVIRPQSRDHVDRNSIEQ